MAKKKVIKKVTEKERNEAGFVLGYDIYWMKKQGEEHPDYKKVMKEAKKIK